MKILVFLTALISAFAHAGDGGGQFISCHSSSERTHLTIAEDWYSDSTRPMDVSFGIDGALIRYFNDYDLSGLSNMPIGCEDDCLNITLSNNTLVIIQGDAESNELEVNFNNNFTKATIVGPFLDPRTYQLKNLNIELDCKRFRQEP